MLSPEQVCESEKYVSSIDPSVMFPVVNKTLINRTLQFQETSTECPDFLYPKGEDVSLLKFLPQCHQLSLSQSLLLEPSKWGQERMPGDHLTKGIVCEMIHLFSLFPNKMDLLANALPMFFQVTQSHKKKLWTKATRMQIKGSKLRQNRSAEVAAFLAEMFHVPTSFETQTPNKKSSYQPGEREVSETPLPILNLSDNVSLVSLQNTPSIVAIKLEHQREMEALQRENENLRSAMASRLHRSTEQMASVRRSKRHFVRKAQSHFAKVQQLQTEVQDLKQHLREEQKTKEEFERKCAKTVQNAERKCAEAMRERRNLQSKVSYHRTKPSSCSGSSLVDRKIEQLKVRSHSLKKELPGRHMSALNTQLLALNHALHRIMQFALLMQCYN